MIRYLPLVTRSTLACSAAFSLAHASISSATMKGQWVLDEHKAPLSDLYHPSGRVSFQRLRFLSHHRVTGFQYFSHAFNVGGEALESEAYDYAIGKEKMTFTSPNGFGVGWPNNKEAGGNIEKCHFRFDLSKDRFRLSGCDLADSWLRVPDASQLK